MGAREQSAEFDQIVHDLRNPSIDVFESETALVEYVNRERAAALLDYAQASEENRSQAITTPQEVADDLREWINYGFHLATRPGEVSSS